ncbi:MAG: hypothetical protein L6R40_008515, partial [Gallowayella cf. fulva]
IVLCLISEAMSDGANSDADGMLGVRSLDVTPSEPSPEETTSVRPELPARHGQHHKKKASVVDYDDDDEQLNSELQLVFDQHAQGGRQPGWLYVKVAVLLISWNGACDDLNTEGEVDDLARMFRERYNYRVRNIRLECNGDQLAQVQVNKSIADFVYDEDGPSTLLIVYYAGHDQDLTKASERNPTIDRPTTVVWNYAEAALQQTKGDIFEIFDCCYAGDLGRGSGGRGFGTRCFEFLGATSSGATTKAPGKHSFTSGLIWALGVLAKESGRFTTSKLANKIREAPNFPQKQVPILYERNDLATLQRIVIAPLSKGDEASATSPAEKPNISHQLWGFLDLRISLEKLPTEPEIKKFAKDVSVMMQTTELRIRHTKWGGLYRQLSTEGVHSPVVRKVVRTWRDIGRRRRRASSAGILSPSDQSPLGSFSPALAQSFSAGRLLPMPHSTQSSLRHAAYHFHMGFRSVVDLVILTAVDLKKGQHFLTLIMCFAETVGPQPLTRPITIPVLDQRSFRMLRPLLPHPIAAECQAPSGGARCYALAMNEGKHATCLRSCAQGAQGAMAQRVCLLEVISASKKAYLVRVPASTVSLGLLPRKPRTRDIHRTMAESSNQDSQNPDQQSTDRAHVNKDGGAAKYDNKFDVDEKVWMKNPDTDKFEWIMYIVAKQYDQNKPGWEYKVKYKLDDNSYELYRQGAWVAEKELDEA